MIPSDAVEPDRCALVVIDMQNDYLHDEGALARMGSDVAALRRVLPGVGRAVELGRDAGVPCIFVRQTHGPLFDSPAWRTRGRGLGRMDVDRIPIVEDGTWGAELFGVSPRPDESVITKHRYSAYFSTDLELTLRARGRDTAVYAGVTTDVCVRYTAVDGLMRGIHPVVLDDATAAGSLALQRQVEHEIRDHVGLVMSTAELAPRWAPAPQS